MIKKLSYLLLVIGIALGPAYWIYAKFFTGEQALLLSLSRTGDGPWRSGEFSMRADMAPAGLILHAQGSFSPGMADGRPPKDRYTATLHRNGAAARPLAFTLNAGKTANGNASFKEHLVLLQVVQEGRYRLEVSALGEPAIRPDQMRLEIRQHLHEPDSRIVTAGMLVFIVGILGLVAI